LFYQEKNDFIKEKQIIFTHPIRKIYIRILFLLFFYLDKMSFSYRANKNLNIKKRLKQAILLFRAIFNGY